MSLIDWSDPEEMLGLLLEYVADEALMSHKDPERARFLDDLSRDLATVAEQDFDSVELIAHALREVCDSQPKEMAEDPVMTHVEACIEELERINVGRMESPP